jgi:hypothetical protein
MISRRRFYCEGEKKPCPTLLRMSKGLRTLLVVVVAIVVTLTCCVDADRDRHTNNWAVLVRLTDENSQNEWMI